MDHVLHTPIPPECYGYSRLADMPAGTLFFDTESGLQEAWLVVDGEDGRQVLLVGAAKAPFVRCSIGAANESHALDGDSRYVCLRRDQLELRVRLGARTGGLQIMPGTMTVSKDGLFVYSVLRSAWPRFVGAWHNPFTGELANDRTLGQRGDQPFHYAWQIVAHPAKDPRTQFELVTARPWDIDYWRNPT